ncbi:MAG: mechanosensitive ion channel family protein [Candidatus Micrarchaeota archaeon]|nr:mechanosensitive ion channel family protein [Candidatus Micrarchaeota archaeon]
MDMIDKLAFIAYLAFLFFVSVLLGKVIGPLISRLLEKLTSKTKNTLDDRIIGAIKTPLESFSFLVVFYFLLHSVPEMSEAATFLEKYVLVILIVIATFTLSEISGVVIRWYYEEGQKEERLRQKVQRLGFDNSLLPLLRKITKLLIYVIGFAFALQEVGFDITGILAITSVTALIIGLASQETLANIFAGIALQIDRPYHYGDYIKLPTGEIAIVRKIGMRSTKLEDMYHNTIILSNSEFAKMRVTNLTLPDDESIVPVVAEIPNSVDLEKLRESIEKRLKKENPNGLIKERGYKFLIESIKPNTVVVSFHFWVKHYVNAEKIKEIVNRQILDFLKTQAKKAG